MWLNVGMADLESQGRVVCLFLADFLVGIIGFVFDAGFPETLPQRMMLTVPSAAVVSEKAWASVLCVLLRSLVSNPSKVAVTVAFGSGSPLNNTFTLNGSPTLTLAGLFSGTISSAWPIWRVMTFVSALSWPTLTMFLPYMRVLFAICGVRHFGHVGLFPAVFVFGPECRAVFGSNEVAAVFNRFAALVLVIVTAFADEVFFAFFGDKLHRLAENVQAVFGNRF